MFEVELLSAISVLDDPELKEILIAEEINLVSCPECGRMFYAEGFILYHDSENELIAFVYPLSFQDQASRCKVKMYREFKIASENFDEKQKIKYVPFLIFGIENLISMLCLERDIEDEESILKYIASKLSLDIIKIAPSLARKLEIPKVLPIPKGEKNIEIELLLSGLKTLIEYNPNLEHYIKFFEKLLEHKIIITDIKDTNSVLSYIKLY
jgi:hypothetical protein